MLTARTYPRRSDAAGADGGGLCVHAATLTRSPRFPPPSAVEGRPEVHSSPKNAEPVGFSGFSGQAGRTRPRRFGHGPGGPAGLPAGSGGGYALGGHPSTAEGLTRAVRRSPTHSPHVPRRPGAHIVVRSHDLMTGMSDQTKEMPGRWRDGQLFLVEDSTRSRTGVFPHTGIVVQAGQGDDLFVPHKLRITVRRWRFSGKGGDG